MFTHGFLESLPFILFQLRTTNALKLMESVGWFGMENFIGTAAYKKYIFPLESGNIMACCKIMKCWL